MLKPQETVQEGEIQGKLDARGGAFSHRTGSHSPASSRGFSETKSPRRRNLGLVHPRPRDARGEQSGSSDRSMQPARTFAAKSQNPEIRWRTAITAARVETGEESIFHSAAGSATRKSWPSSSRSPESWGTRKSSSMPVRRSLKSKSRWGKWPRNVHTWPRSRRMPGPKVISSSHVKPPSLVAEISATAFVLLRCDQRFDHSCICCKRLQGLADHRSQSSCTVYGPAPFSTEFNKYDGICEEGLYRPSARCSAPDLF